MVFSGPLGPSLAPAVRKSRTLYRWLKPLADWYVDLSGYRKVGYKYDDLSLGASDSREHYDRQFRLKRASQCSVLHDVLPKEQWTKVSEDIRYLKPFIDDIEKEELERRAWDNMVIEKK